MGKKPLISVPADRVLARSGLWISGNRQLTLPIEARGLSEITVASGGLSLADFDVLAWLCERWRTRPTETGWMKPTLYQLGSDLYGGPPSGRHYELLVASIRRLALVSIEIDNFDGEYSRRRQGWFYAGHLMEATLPRHGAGLDVLTIRLAEWLRQEITDGAPVRLPWQVLRRFNEQQKLAKRLWIYLAAERWKLVGGDREGCWVAFGDRLEASLGMSYKHPRQSRAALKRACETIRLVDDRFATGTLEVRRKSRGSYDIHAVRPTWSAWSKVREEFDSTRAQREQSRKFFGL